MLYKVNGGDQLFFELGDNVVPLQCKEPLIVVVDPGKTNMAVVIGTASGNIQRIIEFSGKTPEQRAMDTTDYCIEFTEYLTKLLRHNTIHAFCQEQAILKKQEGSRHFHSNMVLTEIRANLIHLSIALTGKKFQEVNNMKWKGQVLPDGYRGRNEKGSKRWIGETFPELAHYSHDVTDALCIYVYMVKQYNTQVVIYCTSSEIAQFPFGVSIQKKKSIPEGARFFKYNPEFSFEDNCAFFINRCGISGVCELPLTEELIPKIYEYGIYLSMNEKAFILLGRSNNG